MRKNNTAYKLETLIDFHPREHFCGYVGVPQGHPLYGFDPWKTGEEENTRDFCPEVHGGLSYGSSGCPGFSTELRLVELNYWWIGFDQARSPDSTEGYDVSQDEWYCGQNITKLLKQVVYYQQYGSLSGYEDQGESYWENPLASLDPEDDEDEEEECWWPDGYGSEEGKQNVRQT